MNANEARLKIHSAITEVLVSMAVEDDSTDEEVEAFGEEMSEVADLILEELGLDVVSVESDTKMTVTLDIYEDVD